MRCLRCGAESATDRKFCAACGNPLSIQCSKCGAGNAPSSTFCEDCGAMLDSRAASIAAQGMEAAEDRFTPDDPDDSPTPEGERKIVTALFADLKGW